VFNQTQREDKLMDWVVSQGAVGAIVWQTAAIEGGSAEVVFNDFEFCKRTPILVLELGKADGLEMDGICKDLAQNGTTFRAELTAGDVNNWKNIRRGPFIVGFRVVGTLISVGTGALALAKYALFIRNLGLQLTIPQIILLIHFLASLFRAIIIALDPIYAGQLFVGYQAHMVSTISLPSLFVATLLLSLYWKESMDRSRVQVNKCLGSMKIPFFILSGIMILVEVINSVLRAVRIGILGVMTTLTAVLYIVVLLTLSLIFFVVGVKILLKLRRSDAMINLTRHSRSKLRLWRLTIFLVVSGMFNIVFIIGWVLGAFEFFLYSPVGFHVFWTMLYASLILSTLTQVLAIKAPTAPGGLTTKMSTYSLRNSTKSSGALSTESNHARSTATYDEGAPSAAADDIETGEEDDEDTGSEN
jgi:hypothetical protein